MTDADRRGLNTPNQEELQQELHAALPEPLEAPGSSSLYALGLLAAGLGGLLVVAAYLGLAGLVLALSWNTLNWLLGSGLEGQSPSWGRIVLGSTVAGVTVAFSIAWVKPFFVLQRESSAPLHLLPETESLVFELVQETASRIGAPAPEVIALDSSVGAGAGFRGGLAGVLRGRLALSLGLPLVHSLSGTQLAGVLAHELGHFRQGLGMRLGFVTRAIFDFADTRAQGKDRWDEPLGHSLRSPNPFRWMPTAVILGLAWCLRRYLKFCGLVGRGAGAYAARQMERDADAIAGRWVGAAAWSSVLMEIPRLELAERRALTSLDSFLHEKRLPADLPALIAMQRQRLEAEVLERLERALDRPSQDLFATHPSERQRLRDIQGLADSEGSFHLAGPASRWFHDLEALSTQVSDTYYQQHFGRAADEAERLTTEEVVDRQTGLSSEAAALGRFFGETLNMVRSLPLEDANATHSGESELVTDPRDGEPGTLQLKDFGSRTTAATRTAQAGTCRGSRARSRSRDGF